MDIIITGFIGLAAGLVLGAGLAGRQIFKDLNKIKDQAATIAAQAEEIDALNNNNLRLRGQCTELATAGYDARQEVNGALGRVAETEAKLKELLARVVPLSDEFAELEEAHNTTKRKLSAAKGQITKLKKAASVKVSGRPYSVTVGDMDIAVGGGGGAKGSFIGHGKGGNK